MDRAIFFTLMARGWSIFVGIVNIFLTVHYLTPAEQGYCYTFNSLVAIQIVFELGFSFVILQMAAHERALLHKISDDGIEGDPVAHARLASIFQTTVRWYTRLAVVLAATLLVAGIYFFSTHNQSAPGVHWAFPWILVVLAAGLTFQIDPIISFLEGCGWVAQTAKMRFAQALLGSLLSWSALLLHHGLFAPGMLILGQAIVGLYFVLKIHGKLVFHLLRFEAAEFAVSWKREILPFQWRIAVSWGSSYFIYQIFNPILFAFRGPVVAGRMGMSLNIAQSVATVAVAWIATKAAPFGSLVATKKIDQLNTLFRKTLIQSTTLLFVLDLCAIAGVQVFSHFVPRLHSRLLPLNDFAILLLTLLLSHIVICEQYYLRAHKQEPFLWFWVLIAIASLISVFSTAKYWGVDGVVLAYFICGGLGRLSAATYVFFKKRREWYSPQLFPSQIDTAH